MRAIGDTTALLSRRALFVLISGAAIILGFKSAELSFASVSTFGAHGTLEAVQDGLQPDERRLREAVAVYMEASSSGDSNLRTHASILASYQANRDVRNSEALQLAERAATTALSHSPTHPLNWLRLSAVMLSTGDLERATLAWQASVMAGRYLPTGASERVRVGLALLAPQNVDHFSALQDQIHLAASHEADALAAIDVAPAHRILIKSVLGCASTSARISDAQRQMLCI